MRSLPLALVYLVYSCACLACFDAEHAERAGHDAIVAGERPKQSQAQTTHDDDRDAGPHEPPPSDSHTVYALAEHLERALLHNAEAQLFDFGVAGDAKYLLGGWLGPHSERQEDGTRSSLLIRGNSLSVMLPVQVPEQRLLSFELQSKTAADLRVFLNGRFLDKAHLRGQLFEAVSMVLPHGALHRGDNTLELRSSQPDFALDYIALSGDRDTLSELTPQAPSALHPEPHTLHLPAQAALSYAFEVPARATFRTYASSGTPGTLTLHILRDNAAKQTLATISVSNQSQLMHCDLTPFAGQLVQLELRAADSDVWLDEPVIRAQTASRAREPSYRPMRNVVLYVIDTLRADKLAAYNQHTRVRTPGLDQFLENAAVMTAARSQENWTKPSVATLLTSLYPWQHATFRADSVLPSSVRTLPEHLSQQGFFTGAFIANGYVSDKFGFQRGFVTYRNYIREDRNPVAAAVSADALAWLDERPLERPFFLYLHTIDPHVPYQPPPAFLSLYDAAPYSGPVDFEPARGLENQHLLERVKLGRLVLSPRDKTHLIALYDAEISYHDQHFAAFLQGLAERGLADDTLVVVTADHGEEFWDHGSVGHGHSVFDELLHVPLFVRLPAVTQRGDRIDTNVGLLDVAPTILDAVGLAAPQSMRGRSFLPELLGDSADAPRMSVSGFMTGIRTLSVGRYKLVQQRRQRAFLYDTSQDPGERHDLASERPMTLAYLRGLLGLRLADESEPPHAYAAQKTAIDPLTEQQLRALGYVGRARHP